MSTEPEVSYGGVVVRGDELLVITPAGKSVTGLPKGGMERGESPEQAAAREVREETGIDVRVGERLGKVQYTYRRSGKRIRKTVHFFRCDYLGGTTDDHDHEVDDARWIALATAHKVLTYPGERALIARLLSNSPPGR